VQVPWETSFYPDLDTSWMRAVHLVLEYFVTRTPKSYIEQEETHVSWYYHDCGEYGVAQAGEMMNTLIEGPLANLPLQIVNTGYRIYVRPRAVSKGKTVQMLVDDLEKKVGRIDFMSFIGRFIAGKHIRT